MRAVQNITFRPLAGKWYRCHQTGERVKRSKLKAYRNQHAYGPKERGMSKPMQMVFVDFIGQRHSCPYCEHRQEMVASGVLRCTKCKRAMNVILKQLPRPRWQW